MSLVLGVGATDKIDCGTGSTLQSLDPMTVLVWCYPTTLLTLQEVMSKMSGATDNGWRMQINTSDQLQVIVGAATSFYSYLSSTTVNSAWNFVGFTFNSGGGANEAIQIYRGTLTAAVAEVAYTSRQDGSGGIDGDAGVSLEIGNVTTLANFPFKGRIAWVGVWNRELSLAEVRAQQWRPHKTSGCVLFMHLGYNGTSTQPDWSGNFNAGTVTGATQGIHVPLQIFQSPNIYSPYVVAAGGFQAAWAMNSNVVLGAGVPV